MGEIAEKRDGFYWKEGRPYVSVTEVLKVISKPAIQYWYGQQVYQEVIKNPEISEKEALSAPYRTSQKAADRGTTIHSIIETYRQNQLKIDTVPEPYRGYAEAFYAWSTDAKPEILESEKRVYQDEMGYAGRLDMVARIGNTIRVIDFKTSKKGEIYNEAHLQVSAYLKCLPEVKDGVIVALSENGQYAVKTVRNGFEGFRHALGLYLFLNEEKIIKYGWKGEL